MIVDQLIELLEQFDVPVYRQGSMAEDAAYPDTFFTFWEDESTDHAHYDDDVFCFAHEFSLNVYSTNPDTAYSLLATARQILKDNGWTVSGQGYDVPSDEPTHVGRGLRIEYLAITGGNENA